MNKAVFIDKDGTLVRNIPYNTNPQLVEFMPMAFETLRALQRAGYLLFLVTNQAGLAKKRFSAEQLDRLYDFLRQELENEDIHLAKIYTCVHSGDEQPPCECRKPLPGMLLRAAKEFDVDLTRSYMIGDILHDVEAGKRAGCAGVLMDVGNETEWASGPYREPDYTITSWAEFLELVLEEKEIDEGV